MLEDKCLKEIFRAQQVFSKRALKNIFEQLAQSSIMKLNRTAMDKVKITEIFCRTNLLTFFPLRVSCVRGHAPHVQRISMCVSCCVRGVHAAIRSHDHGCQVPGL